MTKDGLLWRTGILHGDIPTAMAYYRGQSGCYLSDHPSPVWAEVSRSLDEHGYSAYEYLFWAIHYMEGPFNYAVLVRKNQLLSRHTLASFLDWKDDAVRFAQLQMHIHIDKAKVESLITPLQDVLLDPSREIGPVARIEIALNSDDVDSDIILKHFSYKAGDVLRGFPEFLGFAPKLSAYMEEPDATRQFFS
jgi:hypothetical protein